MRCALLAIAAVTLLAAAIDAQPASPRSGEFVLPGVARPHREVIKSAPLDGVLMRIIVEEGDMVTRDQPLAFMDNRIAEAAVASARAAAERTAALNHAGQELTFARSMLERLEKTSLSGATAQSMLEEARTRVEQARASVESAAEQKRQAELVLALEQQRLEAHTIRAPFDGRIIKVLAEEGAALTTANPIIHLADLTTLRAEIHLPVRLMEQLVIGEAYLLDAEEPVSAPIDAELLYEEPIIDPSTRTIRCVFRIDNTRTPRPAGFGVRPRFDGDQLASAPRAKADQAISAAQD